MYRYPILLLYTRRISAQITRSKTQLGENNWANTNWANACWRNLPSRQVICFPELILRLDSGLCILFYIISLLISSILVNFSYFA
jgi:hypothetical protein